MMSTTMVGSHESHARVAAGYNGDDVLSHQNSARVTVLIVPSQQPAPLPAIEAHENANSALFNDTWRAQFPWKTHVWRGIEPLTLATSKRKVARLVQGHFPLA